MLATRRVSPGVAGPVLFTFLVAAVALAVEEEDAAVVLAVPPPPIVRLAKAFFLTGAADTRDGDFGCLACFGVATGARGGFTEALGGSNDDDDATVVSVSAGFVARGGRVGVLSFAARACSTCIALSISTKQARPRVLNCRLPGQPIY